MQWIVGRNWRIAMEREANAAFRQRASWVNPVSPLMPQDMIMKDFAPEADVADGHTRRHTQFLRQCDFLLGRHREMLDSHPAFGRILLVFQQSPIKTEHLANSTIAVRMNRDLPALIKVRLGSAVELLVFPIERTTVRRAFRIAIGFIQRRRQPLCRAIRNILHAHHTEHIVTFTGLDHRYAFLKRGSPIIGPHTNRKARLAA